MSYTNINDGLREVIEIQKLQANFKNIDLIYNPIKDHLDIECYIYTDIMRVQ